MTPIRDRVESELDNLKTHQLSTPEWSSSANVETWMSKQVCVSMDIVPWVSEFPVIIMDILIPRLCGVDAQVSGAQGGHRTPC